MGFGSAGGGFAGNKRGGSGFGSSDSNGGKSTWDNDGPNGGKPREAETTVNMETEAPIPGEPQLYAEGDVFHVARVTFTVKLVDKAAAEPGV